MTRTRLRVTVLALAAVVLFAIAPAYASDGPGERSPLEDPAPVFDVTLSLTGSDMMDAVTELGIDIEHALRRVPTGIEADATVTEEQIAELEALGVVVLEPDDRFRWDLGEDEAFAFSFEPESVVIQTHEETVRIARADYFTTKGQGFLYVEARTTQGAQTNPVVTMQLANDTGPGTDFGPTRNMSRFVDSGQYMFHRNLFKVDTRPHQIRVTSSTGGVATGYVSNWLEDVSPLTERPGYEWNIVDGYKHPQQLYERMHEIAAQYPDIAEIVYLPNQTNGYQRKAQATIGGTGQAAVVVTSKEWGHEGGNDVSVQFLNPGVPSSPLSVSIEGNLVRVSLATNASGGLASTAAQVSAALRTEASSLIGNSHPYRTNAGTGIVQATANPVALTDFLDQKRTNSVGGFQGAPPGEVPRGPKTVPVLRIGKFRDGRNPGVMLQAQDHAREWVPATATLEAGERLVRNYKKDWETKKIVDNVDIFLIPSNNPDGANYSFYNFSSQRRNMTNHCDNSNSDPARRNAWGVDLNRNYRVGSGQDGYSGASTSCISDTFQGPEKLSEPESKNSIWLVENYPNIKFFMSVHSNGGQLFWQPGAYIANGRITTPRPPLRDEAFYWQSAYRILSHVRAHRETVVTPENVGGSADVLYSSAGNVREDLYHNYGIYAFGWEVGGSIYNPATGNFQGGSFQPTWVGNPQLVSGHAETMEYANGLMEMFRIAKDWGHDNQSATTRLVPGAGTYQGGVDVRFESDEPVAIYYTTDGSRPTLESPVYRQTEFREPGQTLHVTETTTFRWFSVDTAGNIERGYDPAKADTRNNYRQATITIVP